jgi:hypothetical protein
MKTIKNARPELLSANVSVSAIRLIRNRETGMSDYHE